MSESKRDLNASSLTVADSGDHTLRRKPWLRRTTPWADIVGHQYKGAGTESDPYVITWLPEDPENPMNFGNGYKWGMTMLGEWLATSAPPRAAAGEHDNARNADRQLRPARSP